MNKSDMDIKDIAKEIRGRLKKEYRDCKFSVTIKRYLGGQSMNISLAKAPFEALTPCKNNYLPINHYLLNEGYNSYSGLITKEGYDVMKKVWEITKEYNYDRSDIMTDYFDVNFYLHLEIGKWDKPFEVIYP